MKKTFYQLGKKVAIVSALAVCTLFCSNQAFSQGVSINATGTGTAPDGSAILDLDVSGLGASNKKGFLAPRVALTGTADATTIPLPQTSLLVYNTATGGGVSPGFYYNSGTTGAPNWISVGGSGSAPTAGKDIDVSGTTVDIEAILNYVNSIIPTDGGGVGVSSNLTIQPPAGRDLILGANGVEYGRLSNGTNGLFIIGNPSTTTGTLRFAHSGTANTVSISPGSTTTSYALVLPLIQGANGQAMINNGSGTLTWGTPLITGNATLTNGTIWVGNGSNVATERTMSGDAAMSNTGVLDINTNQVDYNEIQQVSNWSVLGNGTNATANVAEITAASSGQVLRRSGATLAFGAVDLASSNAVTGILPIGNGGTGLSSLGNWKVFYTDASGVLTPLSLGAANQALVSNGPAAAPSFQPIMSNVLANPGDIIYSTGGTGVAGTGTPTILNPVAGGATAGMVLHNNGAAAPTWGKVDLAAGPGTQVTGTLPVVNGGTGVATIATNGIMLGAGTSPVTTLVGTNMQTIRNNAGVWTANNAILNDGTHVGIGLTTADIGTTQAFLDITGANTALGNDSVGLNLRMGDAQSLPSDVSQITFSYNGTTNYRHAIKTRHNSSVGNANGIEFYLWDPATQSGTPTAIGRNRMFSINNSGIEFYGALMPGGAAGTSGYVLKTNGAGSAPTWVDPTTLMGATTNTLVNNGTNTLTSTVNGVADSDPIINTTALSQNGTNQLINTVNGVASTPLTVAIAGDVTGNLNASTVARIRGTNVNITSLGTGNILQYNGTDWVNTTVAGTMADLTVQNGLYLSTGTTFDGSTATTIKQGGALTENTAITMGAFTYSLSGNTINLNDAAAASATNIGTGTTTGTVTIGGSGNQSIAIGTGAAAKLVSIGSTNGASSLTQRVGTGNYSLDGAATSTYTIGASTVGGTIAIGGTAQTGAITVGSSSGAQTVNVGTGAGVSTVNIANGAGANVVNIDNGASAGIVQIGRSNAVTINASGNVGIGGAGTNTWKLEITGKVKSTGINETSDVRLKKNFASIDGALNKVLAMNGKYYDWRTTEFPNKGLAEGRQIGVIAQEMEKILPEVVATDGEGYKSVEYGHIVPVLIEAIKEQQKIIDGQKSTIDELKASLENVLNRVNIIEKSADLNSSKVEK